MPSSPAYTQVVQHGPGTTTYVSGQIALDARGQLVGAGDFTAQARQVFRNLEAALAAVGLGFADVVKITTFLKDMKDIEAYRAVRREILPPGAMPASTTVEARLVDDAWLLEVDVIAFRA